MAVTTYSEINGTIVAAVTSAQGTTTPANTIQTRVFADGVDIYDGILAVIGDQTSFTNPHALRSCTTLQWYWDDLRGFGGLPIRAPREGETYGVEVAPMRISDAYANAMIVRRDGSVDTMFNFGSRNAFQDVFTIDTSNVGNSGEYYCVASVGLEASGCILVESTRRRISIIECVEIGGGATPTSPRERRRHTFASEGGMADIRAVHPHYEDISFSSEVSWITAGAVSIQNTDLNNVEDNVYTITAASTVEGRQGYINLNIGSFQCSYAITQEFVASLGVTPEQVSAEDQTAQRTDIDPAIGIISDSGPTVSGSSTVLTANARFYNNSLTSFTAADIGTIVWTADQGTLTATESIDGEVKTSIGIYTPPSDTFTGTINVTATVDGISDSREISYVAASTAIGPDGNIIRPATSLTGDLEGDVFCSSLDGTVQLSTLSGEFTVLFSNALVEFDVDFANFFSPDLSSTIGANRTLSYTLIGPTMLSGSINATATSGRVSTGQEEITPGVYTWTITLDNCTSPFVASDGGSGRIRTFPTIYS